MLARRFSPWLLAMLVAGSVLSAPAQAANGGPQRHCVQAVCFTIPLVKSDAFTNFSSDNVYVINPFGHKAKRQKLPCKVTRLFCHFTGTGFTAYQAVATVKPLRVLWHEVLREDACPRATRSQIRRIHLGPGTARSVDCKLANSRQSKTPILSRLVAWRYGGLTYGFAFVSSGKHPPARWQAMLDSINFRWSPLP